MVWLFCLLLKSDNHFLQHFYQSELFAKVYHNNGPSYFHSFQSINSYQIFHLLHIMTIILIHLWVLVFYLEYLKLYRFHKCTSSIWQPQSLQSLPVYLKILAKASLVTVRQSQEHYYHFTRWKHMKSSIMCHQLNFFFQFH